MTKQICSDIDMKYSQNFSAVTFLGDKFISPIILNLYNWFLGPLSVLFYISLSACVYQSSGLGQHFG